MFVCVINYFHHPSAFLLSIPLSFVVVSFLLLRINPLFTFYFSLLLLLKLVTFIIDVIIIFYCCVIVVGGVLIIVIIVLYCE